MSLEAMIALLEKSIMAGVAADTPHGKAKAQSIGGLMDGLMATAQCLGRVASTVDAVTDRTVMPALDAAIDAVRLADEGNSFAALARDMKKMADQTALSADGILWQCEVALQMAERTANALEEIMGPAAALLFEDDPEAALPEEPLDMDAPWAEGNVVRFPGKARHG
jgi:Methyl-accepting chemotaxis protein (MCP) signaling domain.